MNNQKGQFEGVTDIGTGSIVLTADQLGLHQASENNQKQPSNLNIQQLDEDLSEMKQPKQEIQKPKVELNQENQIPEVQSQWTQQLFQRAFDVAKIMPSYITQGASGLYDYFASRIVRKKKENHENPPSNEKIEDLPIFVIMPEEIVNSDIQTQQQWIEKHQKEGENIQIIAPFQKFIELQGKESQELKSSQSSEGPPPGTDVDILPEYSVFKDPWSKVANLEDSQFLSCSLDDYKEIQGLLKNSYEFKKQMEQEELTKQKKEELKKQMEELQIEKLKKIRLYPFLGTVIKKSDFQKENEKIQNEKVEQLMEKFKQIEVNQTFQPLPEIKVNEKMEQEKKVFQEYEYLLE